MAKKGRGLGDVFSSGVEFPAFVWLVALGLWIFFRERTVDVPFFSDAADLDHNRAGFFPLSGDFLRYLGRFA